MARPSEAQPSAALARAAVRIALVTSSYHADLTGAMEASARRELLAAGVAEGDILGATVPGAFELPLIARRFARRDDIAGVLCFGVVIKGETTHDQHVASGASKGIQQVMLETDKPVLLGVLTTDTLEQARARALPPEAGGTHDKGRECARALIQLLNTLETIDQAKTPAGL
jgi:6,7-dimethyl-8-ribityllumazine synthase